MMKNNRVMWLVYGIVTLVVMLPLLLPGYILALDMVFVPHPPLPEMGSSYLFHSGLHYLSYVIPNDVLQKVILLSILLFSGVGMHKLILYSMKQQESVIHLAAYAAGIFYCINPFMYGRFMAGQYAVLLGYMLLPFFARAFLQFLENPNRRQTVIVTVLTLAISIVSIHSIGLAVIFALIALGVKLWHKHDNPYVKTLLLRGLAGAGVVILLSLYWLIPVLQGRGISQQISGFGSIDQAAFATDGGAWQVLQLHGFWAEAQGLFMPVDQPLPLSGLAQILLWAVIVIGLTSMWRSSRRAAVLWSLTALTAIILALGTPVSTWLGEHIPFFAGYREPHKFVALLALAYAVFVAYGAAAILAKAREWKWRKYVLIGGLAILPFWVAPAMVWGFSGQLSPRQYPSDWYAVNDQLNSDQEDFKVLFLPWHLYTEFGFTGRIVAQPADMFFDRQVVISHDPEFAGVRPQYRDQVAKTLNDDILPAADQSSTLGAKLAPLHIKYVLLAKDSDYRDYAYLDKQQDLQLVTETENLKLYRNIAFQTGGDDADH